MDLGRTPVKYLNTIEKLMCKHSKKSKIHDYMDVFLEFMEEHVDYHFSNYEDYYKVLNVNKDNFKVKFSHAHFLQNAYYTENYSVKKINKPKLKSGYGEWLEKIEKRADLIAQSNKWGEIYRMFETAF